MRIPSFAIGRQIAVLVCTVGVAAAEPPTTGPSPAPVPTPADNAPVIRLGVTLYGHYTYTAAPSGRDADGNPVHPNGFDTSRAYITVSGSLSKRIAYRITADVGPRQSTVLLGLPEGAAVSSNYDGSLAYRLKYAFGQLNLDGLSPGSWLRLGIQQTPYLDFAESTYRYRFQGTSFAEREGYLASGSADAGLSAHYTLPADYGDVHAGIYNGETYAKAESNDRKALQVRASVRPLPRRDLLKGLRLTAFLDADQYVKHGPRQRFLASASFEHRHLHAGLEYLRTKDQPSATGAEVKGTGFSFWATPRTARGFEGLLRYDSLKPRLGLDARKTRTILGAAYWVKGLKPPAAAAVLVDYEHVGYDAGLARPNENRYALRCLINF